MPLGTHQKIFLAWGIFGALGITGFVLAKTTAFENRDEALKARQELRKKLESENHPDANQSPNYTDKMAAPSFNIDSSKLQIMAELEIEMMADMYNRMTRACQRKCIPKKYKDAELSKGESVCIDRCVAKYLDVHENIGKKLTTLSKADEETAKKMQEQQEAAMKAAAK